MGWQVGPVVACTLVAAMLAGCAGGTQGNGPVDSSATTAATPHAVDADSRAPEDSPPAAQVFGAAAPTFSVDAPTLRPGHAWLWKSDVRDIVQNGEGTHNDTRTFWEGMRVVSTSHTLDANPVALAVRLDATSPPSLATAKAAVGMAIDLGTLQEQYVWNLDSLHACQAEPSTCPRNFPAAAGRGPSLEHVSLRFPLTPGATWETVSTEDGVTGTARSKVIGQEDAVVVGASVKVIHVRTTADIEAVADDFSANYVATWDSYYSPAHLAVARETTTLTGTAMTPDGAVKLKQTTQSELTEVSLAATSEPDGVDLYDGLGLYGRHIFAQVNEIATDRFKVAIDPTEVPLADIHSKLLDADGKIVAENDALEFDLDVGGGTYTLRTEAIHKDRVIASYEHAVVNRISTSETLTCELGDANPPAGQSVGSCPDYVFQVRPGDLSFHAQLHVTDALLGGDVGTLQLRDSAGAVVASTRVQGWGYLDLPDAPDAHRGTWTLRYLPDNAVQPDLSYRVQGYYDYLDVAGPTP